MKNHYVSQLILKRFANALYIFDDNAKSISKHTQTENIFYKKDIYTDEVETFRAMKNSKTPTKISILMKLKQQ